MPLTRENDQPECSFFVLIVAIVTHLRLVDGEENLVVVVNSCNIAAAAAAATREGIGEITDIPDVQD